MSADDSIVELLSEICSALGAFKARRMFGGYGCYLDGLFFAILSDGALYFKTTPETQAAFAAEGMGPFTYQTKNGTQALGSYWRVPERLFDETDDMAAWVVAARNAARTKALNKARPAKARRPARKAPPKTNPRAGGARN